MPRAVAVCDGLPLMLQPGQVCARASPRTSHGLTAGMHGACCQRPGALALAGPQSPSLWPTAAFPQMPLNPTILVKEISLVAHFLNAVFWNLDFTKEIASWFSGRFCKPQQIFIAGSWALVEQEGLVGEKERVFWLMWTG